MQATLDERRQATVHKALLHQIVTIIANLPISALDTAAKQSSAASEIAALSGSGTSDLLDQPSPKRVGINGGGTGNNLAPSPAHGLGSEHLAWGGVDVVVFVRHQGLLLTAAASATRVQHPPDTGSWYGTAIHLGLVDLTVHVWVLVDWLHDVGMDLAAILQLRNSSSVQKSTSRLLARCCWTCHTSSRWWARWMIEFPHCFPGS